MDCGIRILMAFEIAMQFLCKLGSFNNTIECDAAMYNKHINEIHLLRYYLPNMVLAAAVERAAKSFPMR